MNTQGLDHELGNDPEGGDGSRDAAPVWAVFGDLMAGLVGAFVLVLVGMLALQMDLSAHLQPEAQRRLSLEQALAVPLAAGPVTLTNGRIGISGSVLFEHNSDALRPDGRALLKTLVSPLRQYLEGRDEVLMVSGFTDDRPIQRGNRQFEDNLELSAQRALTVTRALVDEGLPASRLFAAAFGPEQPVASNANEKGRALNRRVEVAPVPRAPATQANTGTTSAAATTAITTVRKP